MRNQTYYATVNTPVGEVGVVWRLEERPLVTRIILPSIRGRIARPKEGVKQASCEQIDELRRKIELFCTGERVSFDLNILDFVGCRAFQRSVLLAEFEVPAGKVTTYGRLAIRVGNPRAYRAVGGALRNNPFPLVIPCHRTVKGDGSLGGFRGSVGMKRKLLEMEGVEIDFRGKVCLEHFLYSG